MPAVGGTAGMGVGGSRRVTAMCLGEDCRLEVLAIVGALEPERDLRVNGQVQERLVELAFAALFRE